MNLFTQIHEIVFHGKGGYDWNTIYNMPRWLRQFTFNQISEYYKQEAEEYEKASKNSDKGTRSTLIDSSGNIDKSAWKDVQRPTKQAGPSKVKYK